MEQINSEFGCLEPLTTARREAGMSSARRATSRSAYSSDQRFQTTPEALALRELYAGFFGESGVFTPAGQIELPAALDSLAEQARHEELETSLFSAAEAEAKVEPYGKALMLLLRAMVHSISGDRERSNAALSEVQQICDELADTSGSEAERVEIQWQEPCLTPREIEVLQIVAEGCTDSEVGRRLFISPRTVSQHLSSIYSKLSVHSRGLAIRYAVENGLV